ncbi:hypothetical protein [Acinetobacter sp. WZC-1]|uniref:hypothetical protein n=1 Tax=Acinetobacter sp. WZC-1 TaxID=3459034 RepID=UPI00403DE589
MVHDQTGIWSKFLMLLDPIPENNIAIAVYGLGALIILWCWYGIARRLPSPLGGILWIIIFALVATPTVSEGPNSEIAPAAFGLLFGVLTHDSMLIWSNLALIAFVMGIGLMIGYFWSRYKATQHVSVKTTETETISPL